LVRLAQVCEGPAGPAQRGGNIEERGVVALIWGLPPGTFYTMFLVPAALALILVVWGLGYKPRD